MEKAISKHKEWVELQVMPDFDMKGGCFLLIGCKPEKNDFKRFAFKRKEVSQEYDFFHT